MNLLQISTNGALPFCLDLQHSYRGELGKPDTSPAFSVRGFLVENTGFLTEKTPKYFTSVRMSSTAVSLLVDHIGLVEPERLIDERRVAEYSMADLAQIFVVLEECSKTFFQSFHWQALHGYAKKADERKISFALNYHIEYNEQDPNPSWACSGGVSFLGSIKRLGWSGVADASCIHGLTLPPRPSLSPKTVRLSREFLVAHHLKTLPVNNLVKGVVRALDMQYDMLASR